MSEAFANNFYKDRASNLIHYLSLFWITGFFFFPTGQSHNQIFLLIYVLSATWLLVIKKIPIKPFFKSSVFIITFLYCIYYGISTFWGSYEKPGLQLSEIKRVLYLYAFWLVIFSSYYLDKDRLVTLAKGVMVIAALSVCIHLIYFYGQGHIVTERLATFGRLRNALWVGALFGAMAIFALSLTLAPNTTHKKVYLILYIIFLIATFLTQSRGPILSMVAVSILIFFLSSLSIKCKTFTLFIAALGAMVLIYFTPFLQLLAERGQSYRLDLWLGFLEFTKGHFFFGHGAGTNVFISAPGKFVDGWSHYHNIYLGSLVELGVVGLVLHLTLVMWTILIGWRARHHLPVNIALMIFIFTSLIGITYGQGIVTRINVQWIIFWLPLTFIIMHELETAGVKKPELRSR